MTDYRDHIPEVAKPYLHKTDTRRLRHPRNLGLRTDKEPMEVTREEPQS